MRHSETLYNWAYKLRYRTNTMTTIIGLHRR